MSALGHSLRSYSASGRPFVRCWSNSVLDFAVQRAQRSAKLRLMRRSIRGLYFDHFVCTREHMADVNYTIAESYTRATEKIYRKGNIFSSVLAACALTETNDLGQFTVVCPLKSGPP